MIKKRVLRLFTVLLIAATVTACAVGCTFIKKNDYRAANEAYVTINNKGITLTVSYNELMDYFNSMGYYYINYYGYSVGDTLDVCIRTKIQTKYLLTEAMAYLTGDEVGAERKSALVGGGAKVNPVDVLTVVEKYAAIYTVNSSIKSSLESAEEEARQTDIGYAWKALSAEKVEKIVLAEETEEYFEKFFHDGEGCYVGNELDTKKVKIQVVYDDGSKSEAVEVPSGNYSTEFSSSATDNYTERTEDKNFVIKFDENITDKDGNVTTEEHTIDYSYTLIYPRTTKDEPEKDTNYEEVTIGDFDPISRYAKESEIPADIKSECKLRNLEQEYADAQKAGNKNLIEAYRVTLENLNSASKTIDYLYNAQFESAVLSALQAEKYIAADKAYAAQTNKDAQIATRFRYLYTNAKNGYTDDADETKSSFLSAVKEGIDSVYYVPTVDDLDKYYYVSQILFSFTSEMKDFLDTLDGDKDAIKEFTDKFYEELETTPSNPKYDADNYDPEDENREEPFGNEPVLVKNVIAALEDELKGIYDNAAYTLEEKREKAVAKFDEYLYMYNDDPGIFNQDYGYLMTADPDDSGWVEAFNELGDDIFFSNNDGLGGSGKVGNAFDGSGKLAYRCSSFGVHLMMISDVPFANAASVNINDTDENIIAYLKSRVNPSTGKSLYTTMSETLRKENRSLVYNDFVKQVPDDIFERDADNKNKLTANSDLKGTIDINLKKIKKEIYDVYLG